MKKARLILAGIALFAAVGTYAALRSSTIIYVKASDGKFSLAKTGFTFADNGNATVSGFAYSVPTQATTVPVATYYIGD